MDTVEINLVAVLARHVAIDDCLDFAGNRARHSVRHVFAGNDLLPICVDNFSVPIHHIVVLHDVPTDVEVVTFDLGLRAFYRLGDHAMFDRRVLFHTEAFHQTDDPLGSEPAHEL